MSCKCKVLWGKLLWPNLTYSGNYTEGNAENHHRPQRG